MDKFRDSFNSKQRITYCMAALIGAATFVAVYGIRVLNPIYDSWLLGRGDLTQHYLGWCFYRMGKWTFPIGLTDQLAYPNQTSIIFTDSIPLFAVPFKIISPLLPHTFQYFGWWGLISFMLQGILACMILSELRVDRFCSLVGSILFILSPIVIEKMFRHTSLGAHWMVLLPIYFFIRHRHIYQNLKKTLICWGIMGGLVAAVHMYYLPMCGMLATGFAAASVFRERKFHVRYLAPVGVFLAGAGGITYVLGGFSTKVTADADGLGLYGFNLNSFWNAKGYSRWLPSLEMYHEGQYEGFAYLGVGIYLFLMAAFVYIIRVLAEIYLKRRQLNRDKLIYTGICAVMMFGLTVFAASPQVSFGNQLLFVLTDSSTITRYWSIFRASGRVIWPVYYLIMIGSVACYDRCWKSFGRGKNTAAILFAICTFLQVFDIGNKLAVQRQAFAYERTYNSPLKSEIWEELAGRKSIEHIVWVSHNLDYGPIMDFAKYAYDNGWTMNNYYFARAVNVNETTKQSMKQLNDSCIYLFKVDEKEYIAGNMEDFDLNYYEADGYIVGTVFQIEHAVSLR